VSEFVEPPLLPPSTIDEGNSSTTTTTAGRYRGAGVRGQKLCGRGGNSSAQTDQEAGQDETAHG